MESCIRIVVPLSFINRYGRFATGADSSIHFTTVAPQDDGASGIDNHVGVGGWTRWDIALSLKMPNISMSVVEQHDSDVQVSRSGETGGLLARRYIWVNLCKLILRTHATLSAALFTVATSANHPACSPSTAQHVTGLVHSMVRSTHILTTLNTGQR